MKLNRKFSKEETKMAKKSLKKSSLSLAIRRMQITTLRFHFGLGRLANINKTI